MSRSDTRSDTTINSGVPELACICEHFEACYPGVSKRQRRLQTSYGLGNACCSRRGGLTSGPSPVQGGTTPARGDTVRLSPGRRTADCRCREADRIRSADFGRFRGHQYTPRTRETGRHGRVYRDRRGRGSERSGADVEIACTNPRGGGRVVCESGRGRMRPPRHSGADRARAGRMESGFRKHRSGRGGAEGQNRRSPEGARCSVDSGPQDRYSGRAGPRIILLQETRSVRNPV